MGFFQFNGIKQLVYSQNSSFFILKTIMTIGYNFF